MDSRQAASLPLRHKRIHDGARGPPAAGLPAPLLDPPADLVDRRLQALRLRCCGGLLLPRELCFAAAVEGFRCEGMMVVEAALRQFAGLCNACLIDVRDCGGSYSYTLTGHRSDNHTPSIVVLGFRSSSTEHTLAVRRSHDQSVRA